MVKGKQPTHKASFSGIYFINAHFLGQEYGPMSPDDLRVIKCVGGRGGNY